MTGDMTQGNSLKILITFTIPLIFANIFQQLYNTTDAIIVGRFIGKNALASVGVANPIMSIAIFFILGICTGTSLLISEFFGLGEYKNLKKEVSTALIIGITFTLVMSIICIFLSRWILIISGTPRGILNDADIFLKIIFGGLVFSFLYNFYSSVLRAIGNSKTPLIFLFLSCSINGVLCIIFVVFFKLGVASSAIATVIAQGISSVLCVIYVYIKVPLISLNLSDLVIDKPLVKKTIQYSCVTALQQTCLYIGRFLVQGAVNSFGINSIAAYSSVTRVDSLVLAPTDSFSSSIGTYCAQNKGGGKFDRIIIAYKESSIIVTAYCAIAALVIFLGTERIMSLFVSSSEKEVILIGVKYLMPMSTFYILAAFCGIYQGLFRGIGNLRITLIATVMQISIRVSTSYILSPHLGISGIGYAMALGWIFQIIYEGLACKKYFNKIKNSTLKDVLAN